MADTFTVTRSETMNASPDAVFARLRDLTTWNDWSPWAEMDPDQVNTYSGETGEVGSSSAWKGNRKVGEGSMTITAVDAPSQLDIDLNFLKPFKAENDVTFTVEPSGDGSEVTWAMSGQVNFFMKVMALFGRNMDKMVGPDFEKGLTKLKGLVETSA